MGNYIAHTRRKKPKKARVESIDSVAIGARQREIDSQRDAQRKELERARIEKAARALARRSQKRASIVDADKSGRQRTAVRAAGIALISATAGLRTLGISIERIHGSTARDLWSADVKFGVDKNFTHYINDPATPAQIDAIHALRALAPGIAEELFMGAASAGEDENNAQTAFQLAESYIRKTHNVSSFTDDEKHALILSILNKFRNIVALRLRHLEKELFQIVGALMRKPKMSRRECSSALSRAYDAFENYCHNNPKPQLFRPSRDGITRPREPPLEFASKQKSESPPRTHSNTAKAMPGLPNSPRTTEP